jgi:hypothetical protein
MKQSFKVNVGKRFFVGALMLLLSITSIGNVMAVDLSEDEKASLMLMREEEKLARDVYLVLFNKWKSRIFKQIASSEETHMAAIMTLLERYSIEDPASKNIGEFTNVDLKELYKELIVKGSKTLVDAFEVGVIIEEKDIEDLKDGLELIPPKDISTVYINIMQGSYNHLESFMSSLDKL